MDSPVAAGDFNAPVRQDLKGCAGKGREHEIMYYVCWRWLWWKNKTGHETVINIPKFMEQNTFW
jgi:hypothetical protein